MDQQSTSFPSTIAPPTADAPPSSATTEPPQSQPRELPPSTPSAPQNPSTHHVSEPSPPTPEPKPQFSSALSATPHPRPSTTSSTPAAFVPRPGQQNSQFSSPQSWGGLVLGIPASRTSPSGPATPSPSGPFPASFRQQNGVLPQVRQPIQRMQGIAPVWSISSGSQGRPGGIGTHHQQRPAQSPLRSTSSPSSHSASQNIHGPGRMRTSAVGSPALRASISEQNTQLLDQASISSGSQGKPPLPRPAYRPKVQSLSLLQRSQIHPLPAGSQPLPSQPQKFLTSTQHQVHSGQQHMLSRTVISSSPQNQIPRAPSSMVQKPSDISRAQLSRIQPDTYNKPAECQEEETEKRVLSKRSIRELVNQIDPSEKLDPEVEDILVDISEDFVDSITTFGCSLAKHRKSDTLEAKDILLHLERKWNMSIPGFGGDEIKMYRKQVTTDIHQEGVAAIKKSAEVPNARSSFGQASVNSKNNLGKSAVKVLGSPNFTLREVA